MMRLEKPTFKVRLKAGGSLTLIGESYNPYEPSAYVHDPFWECYTPNDDPDESVYMVYMSGTVGKWDDETDTEIEDIGYCLAIFRENKRYQEMWDRIEAQNHD